MKTHLLITKLHPLPLPRGHVSRERLLAQLDGGLHHRLTVVSAPAGFGKTALISEWIERRHRRFCWLTLDEHDNDAARFSAYLLAAFNTCQVEVDPQLLAVRQSPLTSTVESILVPLINAIAAAEERVMLVLDDYHVIQNGEVHELLSYLVAHAPSNLHILIAGRADPPLPLARLRAQGQMAEIRAKDLRFTTSEAQAFLADVLVHRLPEQSVHTLVQRTDGWISGLQMAVISLRNREDPAAFIASFAGSHQHVFDYLTEEVLHKQSPRVTDFLLRTSILKRLCAPLCEAVTGFAGGQQTLEMLQESNAFIAGLDDQRIWFRYHQLFADMLYQRLQQEEPKRIRTFHRRAWLWLREAGFVTEAIDHALAAGAFDEAAAAIEAAADDTLLQGEIDTFLSRVEALPPEVTRARPLLLLYQAEALLLSGQSFQEIIARTEGVSEHIGLQALTSSYAGDVENSRRLTAAALRELPKESYFIRTAITSAMAAMLMLAGEARAAAEGFAQSIALASASGNLLLEVIGSVRKSQLLTIMGEDAAAQAVARQALALARDAQDRLRPLASLPLAHSAYLAYLADDLDAALVAAEQAIASSRTYGGFWALDCHIIHALTLQANGQNAPAASAMAAARELAKQTRANPIDDIYAAAYGARLAIAQGRLDAAHEWAIDRELLTASGASRAPVKAPMFHMQELEQLTLARLHIAEGNPAAALAVLAWLAPVTEELGRNGSLSENFILQAAAYQRQAQTELAAECLTAAFALAEPRYRRRLILEQRPLLDPVLEILAAHGSADKRILAPLAGAMPAEQDAHASHEEAVVEPLSDREIEVLHWLTSELPVPEIATRLNIATSTLRTHIRNIYGKLGVHSRFEAVVKGQELDLL